MVKPSIVAREFSFHEIQRILQVIIPQSAGEWTLVCHSYIFGGLSTTTVKTTVKFDDCQETFVLKIFYPNPAPLEVFQNAINVMQVLAVSGQDIPVPGPVFGAAIQPVDMEPGFSVPTILIKYIANCVAGDVAVETLGLSRSWILENIGEVLGRIHSVGVPDGVQIASYQQGGAVELSGHIRGDFLDSIRAKNVAEFSSMYEAELCEFHAMEGLPVGIIHGDPFLDNFLVDKETFDLRGIVDFEDACIGPLLFDLGSAIAGSCFVSESEMDFNSLSSLLKGYQRSRQLTEPEQFFCSRAVRIALVCNCAFRFITHNGDAYVELLKKIIYMQSNSDMIQAQFKALF